MTGDEMWEIGNRLLADSRKRVHGIEDGCDPAHARYRCGYHEGWEDAIDALSATIATEQSVERASTETASSSDESSTP